VQIVALKTFSNNFPNPAGSKCQFLNFPPKLDRAYVEYSSIAAKVEVTGYLFRLHTHNLKITWRVGAGMESEDLWEFSCCTTFNSRSLSSTLEVCQQRSRRTATTCYCRSALWRLAVQAPPTTADQPVSGYFFECQPNWKNAILNQLGWSRKTIWKAL
jgi:hypothetical protein